MSTTSPNLDDGQRALREEVRSHWILFLTQGLVMALLGLLGVARPMIATLAVDIFVGWLFFISGIVGLAGAVTVWKAPGIGWMLTRAALAIVLGVLLLWRPFAGVLTLTLLLAAFFAAQGITQIIVSIEHRAILPSSWVWVLVSGIVDLLLAAIIISGWPETATWVLGLLVGINLFMSGVALVMTSIACRSVAETPVTAAPVHS
jgi:uncharacterized membrane protein HdeD (DUF308 family)